MSTLAEKEPSAVIQQPSSFFLVAVWFGLLTGLGEVFIRGVQKVFLHQFISQSRDVVWMAPMTDAIIFLAAGIFLHLLNRRWPGLISLRAAVFVFAFLAFLGPLLWFPRLYPYAGAILAVGLAVQTARIVTARPDIFAFLVRRTTGWIAALVVVMGLTLPGWRVLSEYREIKSLPPAPKDAPNVLFIVLDTVRAQSLSLYGYRRPTTPNLERLAKRGVVFQHAIATAPWTLPSHASMFTGRFPHELSADWLKPLDSTYPTIAEVFQTRGYMTAGFVANLHFCTYETGLDRGFVHYEDYTASWKTLNKSSWLARTLTGQAHLKKDAEEITSAFMRWLAQKGDRSFFVFLNYMDAHEPYSPPSPFDREFASRKPRNPTMSEYKKYAPEEIREFKDAYDGAIAYLDHQVGLLLDEIEKRGLFKNTLLIITSDHGEQFGEHGLLQHGNSLYRPLLRVPLIISFPSRLPAGLRIQEPVSLRDLPATITDLLRLKDTSTFPGISLARHWNGSRNPERPEADPILSEVSAGIRQPEWYPISKGDMKSLIIGGYHYIKNGDGGEELYDLKNDPVEENNLIHSNGSPQRVELFRKSLKSILQGDQSRS